MKRVVFFLLITINSAFALDTPFKHGVNITGWFQSPSVGQVQFTKYTKQDLIDIKSLGCDVVRLPINLHAMTSGSPDYIIEPLLYTFLDQVFDWAEELELNLILENDSLDPQTDTPITIGNILIPVWAQMANHYKNRSTYLYYEILNAPLGISNQNWNIIQNNVIDAIRAIDTTHTILVGPANGNSHSNLEDMLPFTDDNLIITFHFYDPFIFTHQGVDSTDPSLESLSDIPFPYSCNNMPELPEDLQGTWIESAYGVYDSDGNPLEIFSLINNIAYFKEQSHYPVFCGEFGVYRENVKNSYRDMWHLWVRMFFDIYKISWAASEYKGCFGIFEKDTYELYNYDLNETLLGFLGFKIPYQSEFYLWTDTTAFNIYDDYIGQNIIESSTLGAGQVNYYSDNSPASDDYCIHFTGVDQYGKITLRFIPIKDLSWLAANNYAIDFYVRSDDPVTKFDLRFVDTKTDYPNDHPWRIRYKIDNTITTWDGNWHHVQIPLNSFMEHGSFDDGQWYDPIGAFNWHEIDRFEIVSEYGDLIGTDLYFDNISIVSPIP
ncbi:MAG: cellulase family glycosylhydrolase [Sedimentisphaerales bacterium]|nr:cellulase family glycosylhydrolase [Sedimentisphaerales bacterium]